MGKYDSQLKNYYEKQTSGKADLGLYQKQNKDGSVSASKEVQDRAAANRHIYAEIAPTLANSTNKAGYASWMKPNNDVYFGSQTFDGDAFNAARSDFMDNFMLNTKTANKNANHPKYGYDWNDPEDVERFQSGKISKKYESTYSDDPFDQWLKAHGQASASYFNDTYYPKAYSKVTAERAEQQKAKDFKNAVVQEVWSTASDRMNITDEEMVSAYQRVLLNNPEYKDIEIYNPKDKDTDYSDYSSPILAEQTAKEKDEKNRVGKLDISEIRGDLEALQKQQTYYETRDEALAQKASAQKANQSQSIINDAISKSGYSIDIDKRVGLARDSKLKEYNSNKQKKQAASDSAIAAMREAGYSNQDIQKAIRQDGRLSYSESTEGKANEAERIARRDSSDATSAKILNGMDSFTQGAVDKAKKLGNMGTSSQKGFSPISMMEGYGLSEQETRAVNSYIDTATAVLEAQGYEPFEIDNALRRADLGEYIPKERVRVNYSTYTLKECGLTDEQIQQELATYTEEDWKNVDKDMMASDYVENSMADQLANSIISMPIRAALSIACGAVGLVDMGAAAISGRKELWKFTDDLQDMSAWWTQFSHDRNHEIISTAADVGAEIMRMRATSLIGSALTPAATTTSGSAAGTNFLFNFMQKNASHLPFISGAIGNYYLEAVNGGATPRMAALYAIPAGALEGYLESLEMGEVLQHSFGMNIVGKKIAASGLSANFKQFAITKGMPFVNFALGTIGEGLEEAASYYGSSIARMATWDKGYEMDFPEMWDNAKGGLLIGGIMNGLSMGAHTQSYKYASEIYKGTGGNYAAYLDSFMSAMHMENMNDVQRQALIDKYNSGEINVSRDAAINAGVEIQTNAEVVAAKKQAVESAENDAAVKVENANNKVTQAEQRLAGIDDPDPVKKGKKLTQAARELTSAKAAASQAASEGQKKVDTATADYKSEAAKVKRKNAANQQLVDEYHASKYCSDIEREAANAATTAITPDPTANTNADANTAQNGIDNIKSNEAHTHAVRTAADLILSEADDLRIIEKERRAQYKELKKFLREKGIALSERQKNELEAIGISMTELRKKFAGQIAFRNDGVSTYDLAGNFAKDFPEIFGDQSMYGDGTPEAWDGVGAIDAINGLKETLFRNSDRSAAVEQISSETGISYGKALKAIQDIYDGKNTKGAKAVEPILEKIALSGYSDGKAGGFNALIELGDSGLYSATAELNKYSNYGGDFNDETGRTIDGAGAEEYRGSGQVASSGKRGNGPDDGGAPGSGRIRRLDDEGSGRRQNLLGENVGRSDVGSSYERTQAEMGEDARAWLVAHPEVAKTLGAADTDAGISHAADILSETIRYERGIRNGLSPEEALSGNKYITNKKYADVMSNYVLNCIGKAYPNSAIDGELGDVLASYDNLINGTSPALKDLGANTPTPAVQEAPQSINDLTPDTPIDQADAIIEHAIAPAFRDNITAMNRAKRWIYKNFVSGQESLERFSKKQASIDKGTTTVDAAVQQLRNIGGTVDYIMDTELVDRDRNPTGLGSYKQIMTPPDGIDFDVVQEYLLNKHNVDRMSLKQRGYDKNKAVMANENGRARTAKQSREIVQQMEQQYPSLKAWDNRRKNWWNTFVREHMVATGLISDESWQEWCKQYPNYVPTFRKIFDERGSANSTKGSTDIGGRVRSAKGSKLEVVDVRESFADYINSMVRASAKNDVILNMFNFAESHPDAVAEYCQIIDDQTGNINPTDPNLNPFDALATEAYNEAKDGQYILRCKIDGYWRAMSVSKDVYDGVSDLFSRDYSDTERVLMDIGTKLNWGQKALITGYNPFFAIRNTLRDTQTAYLNDEGMNPLSFLKSLYDAAKDMITDSPDFEKFKAYGGDRSGFFKSNEGFIKSAGLDTEKGSKAARTAKKAVMFIPNAFAKMGEASETLNRYASAKRYLNRHGGSIDGDWQSAMLASAEGTTNFSRSGKVAKLADCYALYLNANIQGTDKMLRQYTGADTAAKTWGKTAGMAIASVLLKYLFNNDDNEHYRNLSNYIKDNNYCIPNILGERDENGYCTSFIVLPKPQGYGAIIAGFERIATMWDEDKSLEEAYDGYMDSLSGALPVNSSLPWSAFKQAINNENWYGGTIEPQRMEDLPVEERYDNGTSTIAINLAKGDAALMDTEFGKWLADSKLGKKLGIGQWSPMKIDYLLEQKTGVGGDFVLPPLAVENFENYGTDEQRFNPNSAVKGLLDPIKTQFVKDPLYSNDIMGKFYDAKEDAKAAADEAKKLRNSAGIDEVSDDEKYYYHYSDMSSWISYSNAKERDIRNSEPNTKERDEKIRTLRKERIDNLKEFMANPEGYKPPKVPKNFWKNRNGR